MYNEDRKTIYDSRQRAITRILMIIEKTRSLLQYIDTPIITIIIVTG